MNFQFNLIHTIGSDIHPSHMEQLMLGQPKRNSLSYDITDAKIQTAHI